MRIYSNFPCDIICWMLSRPQQSGPSRHVCMCVWGGGLVCVHVYCVWMNMKKTVPSPSASTLSSETVSLEPGTHEFNQTSWPVSFRDLPLQCTYIKDTWHHTWFLCVFWKSNSAIHAYAASTLPTEPHPQPFHYKTKLQSSKALSQCFP